MANLAWAEFDFASAEAAIIDRWFSALGHVSGCPSSWMLLFGGAPEVPANCDAEYFESISGIIPPLAACNVTSVGANLAAASAFEEDGPP